MRKINVLLMALVLALAGPLSAAFIPPTPAGEVQFFSINTGLILELYNVAQQHNGSVTSYPAGLNPTVVQATVKNVSGADQQLCFQIVVQEEGHVCSDNGSASLVWSPVISTKDVIKAGEIRTLGADAFETNGSFQGDICSSFEDDIKNDFNDIDPSKLSEVVDRLLKRKFKVCLVPVACGSGSNSPTVGNAQSQCTYLTLFQPNPGAQASVAMIIYPHNNGVPDCNLNFLWTPALFPGLGGSDIAYTVEVLADAGDQPGESIQRVDVPAGQTYYQWSARDRSLTPGKKYWWRVISRKAKNGQTFGGPDGRGWNIQKWFICGESQAQACHYTLKDLDKFVQANAKPDVREALKGFLIQNITDGKLDDAAVCRLLSGAARLESISVTKK